MRYIKRLPTYFALAIGIIFVLGTVTIVSAVNVYAYKTRSISEAKKAELRTVESQWEIKRAIFHPHDKPKKFDVDITYHDGDKS